METQQKEIKNKLTPEAIYAWLMRRQERKRELQEQFQKNCESGKVDAIIRNGKPANR